MKSEVQRYLVLLERRLATLRLLAADLDESRSAYVTLDLQGFRSGSMNETLTEAEKATPAARSEQ